MKEEPNEKIGKFVVHGEGLGIADESTAEQRALELARSDGRTEPNQKDLEQARLELQGVHEADVAPEMPGGVDEVASWSDMPGDAGHKAPIHTLENDEGVGEMLLREGLEEAEHDSRLSSSDTLEEDTRISEG